MNGDILKMLPFLIPLVVLELVLLVVALTDIIKRQSVRGDNKVVWVLVIVLVQVFGPIAYFVFGRKEADIDSN
jgi:hypothetical protein